MSSTILTVALDADAGGYNGYTSVQEIAVAAFTLPSDALGQIRVTFQAGAAEGLTITNSYIGHKAASGNAYDFAATPIQLLWAGSGTKAISVGAQATTDWAAFAYNKTSNLLIASYINGGASVDTFRRKTGLGANYNEYEKSATNEAGTVVKSAGYTTVAGNLVGITSIEVEIAGSGFFLFF